MLSGQYQFMTAYAVLDGLYAHMLGNVSCTTLGYVMLDGLYQYRLCNVGWAVQI